MGFISLGQQRVSVSFLRVQEYYLSLLKPTMMLQASSPCQESSGTYSTLDDVFAREPRRLRTETLQPLQQEAAEEGDHAAVPGIPFLHGGHAARTIQRAPSVIPQVRTSTSGDMLSSSSSPVMTAERRAKQVLAIIDQALKVVDDEDEDRPAAPLNDDW